MAKNKKGRRSDYITYLLLRVLLFFLRVTPKKLSRGFCVRLGRLLYKLDKKHRNMTRDNLKLSFPDKSDDEIGAITRQVFDNLGATIFDFAILPKINKGNYQDYFEYEGTEHVKAAVDKKQGILFLAAHLCCWEMMSVQCFINGPTAVLAKDIHNEHVNQYVKDVRGEKDVRVLPVRNSVRDVIKILRGGGTVHTLMDQYTHKHEAITVDFFGREAWTTYFIPLLALKLNMVIIPTFVKRDGDFKYKLCYKPPVELVNTGDRDNDIQENTQRLTKVIENEISTRPEDWFWMHNRWKN